MQAPSGKYLNSVFYIDFVETATFNESITYVATDSFHTMPVTGYATPDMYLESGYICR